MRLMLRTVAALALLTGSLVGGAALAPPAVADDIVHVDVHPEPTVLAPGLRPTLTMSARLTVRDTDVPIPGRPMVFKVFGTEPVNVFDRGGGIVVCQAVTDANGFASCKGQGLLGAVLSLLAGRSYAIHMWDGGQYSFNWAEAPVIQLQ